MIYIFKGTVAKFCNLLKSLALNFSSKIINSASYKNFQKTLQQFRNEQIKLVYQFHTTKTLGVAGKEQFRNQSECVGRFCALIEEGLGQEHHEVLEKIRRDRISTSEYLERALEVDRLENPRALVEKPESDLWKGWLGLTRSGGEYKVELDGGLAKLNLVAPVWPFWVFDRVWARIILIRQKSGLLGDISNQPALEEVRTSVDTTSAPQTPPSGPGSSTGRISQQLPENLPRARSLPTDPNVRAFDDFEARQRVTGPEPQGVRQRRSPDLPGTKIRRATFLAGLESGSVDAFNSSEKDTICGVSPVVYAAELRRLKQKSEFLSSQLQLLLSLQ